jgi:hypothetical protein
MTLMLHICYIRGARDANVNIMTLMLYICYIRDAVIYMLYKRRR